MKLAVIAPPELLHLVESFGTTYHMALGQEVLRNPAYAMWYRQRRRMGDFVLMDNGAAEPIDERVPFWAIVEAANEIPADEICLPDELYDASKTFQLTVSYQVQAEIPARYRMIIPQGRDFEQWKQCLTNIAAEMDFRSIGVAKHLEKTIEEDPETGLRGRARAVHWLVRQGYVLKCDIHLLGIWEKPFQEVHNSAVQHPYIRGIDSGAPIAYAQNGVSINDDEHYSLSWTNSADHKLILQNIADLNEACATTDLI